MFRYVWLTLSVLVQVVTRVTAYCDDPSPAFPLPNLDSHPEELKSLEESLNHALKELGSLQPFNATSFSLEITSSKKTLVSLHHTAVVRSEKFAGTDEVDASSLYRIASMTKPFTVLAILQQHSEGNLHLDDPVNKYIAALNSPQNGSIPWHDITIRALASQISGIPRDIGLRDLVAILPNASNYGFPPASIEAILPQCDNVVNYTRRCTDKDLTDAVQNMIPIYAPNQKSSYSNTNFNLLSLVIENVTGTRYDDYVRTNILNLLKMEHSTFDVPPVSKMVIPAGIEYYWNVDLGIMKATGGMYSSTEDMSKFLRYVLTHYNGLTPALNWFQPTSWANSMNSFYGMPWEIFRTNKYLSQSSRPITLVTKSGGHPGYSSIMIMVPEYAFGMTILVAGNGDALAKVRNLALPAVIRYADNIAQKTLRKRYTGNYHASDSTNLNSSISVTYDHMHGLVVNHLVSNGTEPLKALIGELTGRPDSSEDFIFTLVPTLLYQDEKRKQGEQWRVLLKKKAEKGSDAAPDVWNNFCITDVDYFSYAGLPVNEVVFWGGDESEAEAAKAVELTAFKIVLDRSDVDKTPTQEFEDEL